MKHLLNNSGSCFKAFTLFIMNTSAYIQIPTLKCLFLKEFSFVHPLTLY